jgi:hypothetical protein
MLRRPAVTHCARSVGKTCGKPRRDSGHLVSSWPETLVLYRTRPTVNVQVSPGSPAGRVRYSCLKGAARGEVYAY